MTPRSRRPKGAQANLSDVAVLTIPVEALGQLLDFPATVRVVSAEVADDALSLTVEGVSGYGEAVTARYQVDAKGRRGFVGFRAVTEDTDDGS